MFLENQTAALLWGVGEHRSERRPLRRGRAQGLADLLPWKAGTRAWLLLIGWLSEAWLPIRVVINWLGSVPVIKRQWFFLEFGVLTLFMSSSRPSCRPPASLAACALTVVWNKRGYNLYEFTESSSARSPALYPRVRWEIRGPVWATSLFKAYRAQVRL